VHPSIHAGTVPDKAALIVAETGETWSYAALDAVSNQVAQLLRAEGCAVGDTIAVLLDNIPDYFPIVWGAQRAGLFYVCIPSRLTAPEIAYIVADSGAKLIVASAAVVAVGALAEMLAGQARLVIGGAVPGWRDWAQAIAAQPATPIADERAGVDMLYSSGTTGRPKGVRVALPDDPSIAAPGVLATLARALYGLGEDSIYLSPAPLYHAAPLRWSMAVMRLGGTVVMMRHFDAEAALAAIERYRINASQWVPTHFVRLLKLPEAVRAAYDVSSLKLAIHAAAPCPIPVKRAMIDWWGPVLQEYYAGSEGNGLTTISSAEWLARPGSVGKAVYGTLHICDDAGNEVPVGEEGLVYFEGGGAFEYHNDPAKTAEARNAQGWTTLGDIGRTDADGYLYLTDRKSFMIISGGVNIYPQEIENRLITHPRVADAAVIGAPCPEMGERVVAVVQPVDMAEAGPALAEELTRWCRAELSGVKTPRQIDFEAELPRAPTGKLYKRLLRDRYWGRTAGGLCEGERGRVATRCGLGHKRRTSEGATAMNDRVTITVADHIADVRLNRPDKMNALDPAMFDGIVAALAELGTTKGVRAVVLSGEGRGFCAGLDMASMAAGGSGLTLGTRDANGANIVQQVAYGWRALPMPVIAAVHGVAFGGGCQIIAGADVRIAAPGTRLAIREVHWGLVPDMAGFPLWRTLVRDDVLRELTYTAREFDAAEALAHGFITRIADDPHAAAMALAREIAARSPAAVRGAKRLCNAMHDLDVAALLALETAEQLKVIRQPEQIEAVMANMQKRAPVFED